MKLNARVTVFGLATLILAAFSAFGCLIFALVALGFGGAIALAPEGSFGFGAAFGIFGTFAALIGLAACAVQAWAGTLILKGRTAGLVLGFIFSALSLYAGFHGAWFSLAYGLFGAWALWSSRRQFS